MQAKYWIAQYIKDVFRNEPRNVGVFIQIGDNTASKFLGETNNSELDGRKIKSFAYPNVYKQWVDYWRRMTIENKLNDLPVINGSHFRVVEAGNVSNIESDSPDEIINYLFPLLVSDGGYKEAIPGSIEDENQSVQLKNEVIDTLKKLEIFNNSAIKHPIKRGEKIQGKTVPYTPAFTQENGTLYVMETIDFTSPQKNKIKEHAGFLAYLYNDIKSARAKFEPISIIKLQENDEDNEDVKDGIIMLKNESDIINWLNTTQKNEFLDNRRQIAYM